MKLNKSLKVLAVSLLVAGSFGLAQANSEIIIDQATAMLWLKCRARMQAMYIKLNRTLKMAVKYMKAKFSTTALNMNSKLMPLPVKLLIGT